METKRFSGQLSYTLSKTDRVFHSLNFGHPIPFKFDRRHMLNFTGEYKLSKGDKASHSLTAGVSFMNGHWETVKSGSYPIYSLGSEEESPRPLPEHLQPYQPPQCLQSVLGQRGGSLEEAEHFPIMPNFTYRISFGGK